MRVYLILLFVLISGLSTAQTKREIKKERRDSIRATRNLRFSILGGPGYTPDFGFVIGGSALFTFSTKRKDSTLKRSVIPIAFAYMTRGGARVNVRPQLFFNQDRFRIFGTFDIGSSPDNYYGVGFDRNIAAERSSDSSEYRNTALRVNPIFQFRFKDSHLFYGAAVDFSYKIMDDPSLGVQKDPNFIADGGTADGLTYINSGLGVLLNYDTRDLPANAYSGFLLDGSANFYSTVFGGSTNFNVFQLQYRHFIELKKLGPRKTLGWMFSGRFTTGDVPITELSMIGSPFNLRGYYMGQHRDKNALYGLLEYRHMFNAGDHTKLRRFASRLGFVTWAGVGTTLPDLSNWHGVLPNLGAGFRYEVQPRMNFRIDVGYNPINNKALIYFGVTEAF